MFTSNVYQTIEPSAHLKAYVKDYLLLHFVFPNGATTPIKPFPAVTDHCMVFYLRGGVNSFDATTNRFERFAKIAINGSQVSPFQFHLENEHFMLSINFQPGALSKFLKSPLLEFTDKRIDGEAVFGSDVRQTYEQLVNAKSYHHIIQVAEAFLWNRIKNLSAEPQPIDKVANIIYHHPANFEIEKMAELSCLSIRQFERKFEQNFGIPPKLYCRINRFSQAFRLKDSNTEMDWLSVAVQTGYYDYQHLVKDFKQFAGATPSSLLEAQQRAPEKILGFAEKLTIFYH